MFCGTSSVLMLFEDLAISVSERRHRKSREKGRLWPWEGIKIILGYLEFFLCQNAKRDDWPLYIRIGHLVAICVESK